MKLSEYGQLIQLLDKFNIPYTEWENPEFIDDKSLKAGAVRSVSIRDSVHIQFDANHDCISSATDSINSTVLRKKKK